MFSRIRCGVAQIMEQTALFSKGTLLLTPVNAQNLLALKYCVSPQFYIEHGIGN